MSNYVGGDNSNQMIQVDFNSTISSQHMVMVQQQLNHKIQWAINSGSAYLGKSERRLFNNRSGGLYSFGS